MLFPRKRFLHPERTHNFNHKRLAQHPYPQLVPEGGILDFDICSLDFICKHFLF